MTRTAAEAEVLLADLLVQLRADESKWPALARQYSEDPSALKGGDSAGDMGWVSREKMPKGLADVAFALKGGEFGDLVSTENGIHLLQRFA